MAVVYVDTNVWIAHFAECEPYSAAFFRDVASCMHDMVISELVIDELIRNDAYDKAAFDAFEREGKLRVHAVTDKVRARARTVPTHFADAIHAASALEANAVLLTWNVRDFKIPGLRVMKPNDIK